MAETQTFTAPITGDSVNNAGAQPQEQPRPETGFVNGQYVPPSKRVSLHNVRMAPRQAEQVETAPVWVENRSGGRFEYRPVERQAEPAQADAPPQSAPANDALTQQISQLTNVVTLLAQQQLGIQPDAGPQMPNPAAYDFYDPEQEGQYHQAMREYMEAEWERRKQAELEPYRGALDNAKYQHDTDAQFNELQEAHGDDPNFPTVMRQALHIMAKTGIGMKEAYAKADSRDNKPGQHGGHLPEAITKAKFPSIKAIVLHNQLTGRSRR